MYFFVVEEFNVEPYIIDGADGKTKVNPTLIDKIIEFETQLLVKIEKYLETLTKIELESGYKNSTSDIKLKNIDEQKLVKELLPLLKTNIDKDFYSEFVSKFHLKQKDTPTPPSPASTTIYNNNFIKSFQLRLLLIYIYYTDKFSDLNENTKDLKMIDFQYNNDTSINQYTFGNIDKLYDIDIFNKLGLFGLNANEFNDLKINNTNANDKAFYNKIHLDITLFIEIFRKLKEELGAASAAAPPYLTGFFTNLLKYNYPILIPLTPVTSPTGTPLPPPLPPKPYLTNLNFIYEPKKAQLKFEFNLTKKYFELLSLINKNINSNSIPV
tara:strand:+ start:1 stop:978 length:978 start_codon:yes stop_codon:yes gene_type:complete